VVIFATSVVKAVREFVPNDCSKRAIVHGRVAIVVEKRGGKKSRWKDDFVERGIVVCVDGLWGHVPSFRVCTAVDFPEHVCENECIRIELILWKFILLWV